MKRIVLYVLILAAVFLLPIKPAEVENLEPIQTIWLYTENGNPVMQTDTEDKGSGASISEALEDMKLHSDKLVYLDTAQYLLVSEDAVDKISEIQPFLKESVRICLWDGAGEMAEASMYMQTHEIGCRLSQWNPGVKLPNLTL